MRLPLISLVLLAACGEATPTIDASLLTEGTLAVERLPEEVVLADELPAAGVTTSEMGDAIASAVNGAIGALSYDDVSGSVPEGALPADVVLVDDPLLGGVNGEVVTDFTGSILIDSTNNVELTSVDVGPGAGGASLIASVTVEKAVSPGGRYQFTIRSETCEGTTVGYTMWRPTPGAEGAYVSDSVVVVGYVADATTVGTYVVCGQKYDSSAPTGTVGPRGLVAHW